jgi:hypothetical protein
MLHPNCHILHHSSWRPAMKMPANVLFRRRKGRNCTEPKSLVIRDNKGPTRPRAPRALRPAAVRVAGSVCRGSAHKRHGAYAPAARRTRGEGRPVRDSALVLELALPLASKCLWMSDSLSVTQRSPSEALIGSTARFALLAVASRSAPKLASQGASVGLYRIEVLPVQSQRERWGEGRRLCARLEGCGHGRKPRAAAGGNRGRVRAARTPKNASIRSNAERTHAWLNRL